jgi:AraC-like DNA-binding protein
MTLLSTDQVPPRARLAFWREIVGRQLMAMHVRQVGDEPIRGELREQPLGELAITAMAGANVHALHTRADIDRSAAPIYSIGLQGAGTTALRRRGTDVVVTRGEIFVLDTFHEFELHSEQPFRRLVLKLPKPWLDARMARPDLIPGTVLRRDNPVSPLFASYVRNGFETATELSAAAAALFAAHAVELLALALGENPSQEPLPAQALREALFVRANRLIALRFAEPALAPERIARALGVSMRMLQRIFAERGATVMGRVWEERVSRAAKLLAMPEASHRTVTEIAFACGFNDSAHFTRAFASRMAVAPSRWRHQVCGEQEHASDALASPEAEASDLAAILRPSSH